MSSRRAASVVFVGAGIRGRVQLTLEAILALRAVDRVLFFGGGPIAAEWLTQLVGASEAEDISPLYLDGGVDRENYGRIVARVRELVTAGDRVAILMPGHPRLGVSLVELVEHGTGVPVAVVDGISSFDTIYSDLRREPLEHGCLVVDSNRLLLYRPTLDPLFDHLIYHVCSVGTHRTFQSEPLRDNRFGQLVDYLTEFFPDDRPIRLVESQVGAPVIAEATVGSMMELAPLIEFGTTLFVAGARADSAPIDSDFQALLHSTAGTDG